MARLGGHKLLFRARKRGAPAPSRRCRVCRTSSATTQMLDRQEAYRHDKRAPRRLPHDHVWRQPQPGGPKEPDATGANSLRLKNFLNDHREIELVWMDYSSMPQQPRSARRRPSSRRCSIASTRSISVCVLIATRSQARPLRREQRARTLNRPNVLKRMASHFVPSSHTPRRRKHGCHMQHRRVASGLGTAVHGHERYTCVVPVHSATSRWTAALVVGRIRRNRRRTTFSRSRSVLGDEQER